MERAKVGTLTWTEETGGKLGWRDRLALAAQIAQVRWRSRLAGKARDASRHLEVDDILPPDTAICKAAEALSRDASEPFLFNHCLRAYFWSRLLNGSREIDGEALYIALLLHDLGLTKAFRLKPGEGECFSMAGARAVQTLARKHRWPDRRANLTAEAITLHLNVTVDARYGPEARLVRFGSGADVAGLGLKQIPKDQQVAVVDRFPRFDFKRNMHTALHAQVCDHPQCRIAFMYKRGGFGGLIRNAPFPE